jgi:hypothetical protein
MNHRTKGYVAVVLAYVAGLLMQFDVIWLAGLFMMFLAGILIRQAVTGFDSPLSGIITRKPGGGGAGAGITRKERNRRVVDAWIRDNC